MDSPDVTSSTASTYSANCCLTVIGISIDVFDSFISHRPHYMSPIYVNGFSCISAIKFSTRGHSLMILLFPVEKLTRMSTYEIPGQPYKYMDICFLREPHVENVASTDTSYISSHSLALSPSLVMTLSSRCCCDLNISGLIAI